MSKRFLDTGIWPKRWFRELPPAEKTAWFYILTNCDAVGVWDADLKLAEFSIGAAVDWERIRTAASGNIEELETGKWWVVDFCKYQYGTLREECRPHASYLKLLQNHGLLERVKGMGTLKEKELEKEKEQEKEKKEVAPGVLLTTSENLKLVAKYGADNTTAAYNKLSISKQAHGYKYKSDYAAILNWVMDEVQKKVKAEGVRGHTPGWVCAKCGHENHDTGGVCGKCREVRE